MKVLTVLIIFLQLVVVQSFAAHSQDYPLASLVREAKIALLEVQQKWIDNRLPLREVVLEVNTQAKTGADGKVSFYVIELGGGTSNAFTSKMVLTLLPPDAEEGSDASRTTIAEALAASILSAGGAIEAAAQGAPSLRAKEFVAEISFAVEQEGSGGIRVVFPPFEVGGGGEVSSAEVHSIRATYGRQ